jgi:hypothetical protein
MRWKAILLASLLALMLGASAAMAQGGYTITWWTVDGGGETFSTSGSYSLGGTIGQPDAGLMLGGDYALVGGFWGQTITPYHTYLPVVLRG